MNEVEMKIRDYVADLFRRHDLNILSSEKNRVAAKKVVTYCMEELEKTEGLLEELNDDSNIKFFVNQTILRMI